jgi:3-oxoacyl-[acyl-carrier protein] reductase
MDYLLSLSRNATTKSLVKSLGLPVTLPPVLRRPKESRALRLLSDVEVVVGAIDVGDITRELGRHLAPMGARVVWTGAAEHVSLFTSAGEAWAEPVRVMPLQVNGATSNGQAPQREIAGGAASENGAAALPRPYGLVFDATGLRTRRELDGLFAFFSTWTGALANGGRVIVLATPPDVAEQVVGSKRAAEVAGLWQGLEGFVRSLGKELGRKGSTANLLWVVPGAEDGLAGPLRFFSSGYSAFVTCQQLRVGASAVSNKFSYEAPLRGKVALVTGAARGIGQATVASLFAEGAKLAMVEHPSAASEASVTARRFDAKLLLCDLAEEGSAEKISQWVAAEFGGLDIVVHNAGLTRDKTLARMQREAWDAVLDVNLEAVIRVTEVLLRERQIREQGRIIVLSSVGGIAGNVGQTNYALTKASLIGWTRVLAQQLASRGITVNAVAPGFIETRMTAQMPAMIKEFARRLSALNQGGLAEDVASAVTFFALPESFGVTGSVLRVCGGALIGA